MSKPFPNNKQSGFNQFELIVVISLISVLSAVAVHKLLPLTENANIALLQGAQKSLEEAAALTYNKAVFASKTSLPADLVTVEFAQLLETDTPVETVIVATRYGSPQALWSEVTKITQLDNTQWLYSEQSAATVSQPAVLYFWSKQGPGTISNCHIRYQEPLSEGQRPQITINKTGC